MSSIFPVCETVDIKNEHLKNFCRQINRGSEPVLVPVIDTPLPFANCYWNVETIVQKFGGRMILGWDVSLWPGSHLAAVHHAIYLDSKGSLHDVSQRMSCSSDTKNTIFIPDNTYSVNLNRLPSIGMKFFIINESEHFHNYINAYFRLNKIEKENSDFLYAIGFRCEPNRALANGLPPQGIDIDEDDYIICQKFAEDMHRARVEMGESMRELRKKTGHL